MFPRPRDVFDTLPWFFLISCFVEGLEGLEQVTGWVILVDAGSIPTQVERPTFLGSPGSLHRGLGVSGRTLRAKGQHFWTICLVLFGCMSYA